MKALKLFLAFLMIVSYVSIGLGVWWLVDLGFDYVDSYKLIFAGILVIIVERIIEKIFINRKKSL